VKRSEIRLRGLRQIQLAHVTVSLRVAVSPQESHNITPAYFIA
jgi:hypothetical protein